MYSKSEEAEIRSITNVKWSSDNIGTFLETYINYELLWNVRHYDYPNKGKRESAMTKLMVELIRLGVPVPDLNFLRARIKAIKTTYRGELLKVTESKTSGTGNNDVYVPRLSWYTVADRFLRDVSITRKLTSDLVKPPTNAKDDGMDLMEIDDSKNQTVEDEQNVDKLIKENTPQHPLPSLQINHTNKRGASKLSKIEVAIDKLQKITKSSPPMSNKVQPEEIEIFGKYVVAQLRDLPKRNRLSCQEKIQSMLIKERLKLLESPGPSKTLSGTPFYSGESDDEDGIRNKFIAEGD